MTASRHILLLGSFAFLAGCDRDAHLPVQQQNAPASHISPTTEASLHSAKPTKPASKEIKQGPHPLAAELVKSEWSKADNRAECAPMAFTNDGGVAGTPRRANFSGGWAVAFDTPDKRSAYGIAGAGLVEADGGSTDEQERRLKEQWPYFVSLANLPQPAFAGYGLIGAKPYPDDNLEGRGLDSLAYVRIGAATCTYNVWSSISRAHLETLMSSLRAL